MRHQSCWQGEKRIGENRGFYSRAIGDLQEEEDGRITDENPEISRKETCSTDVHLEPRSAEDCTSPRQNQEQGKICDCARRHQASDTERYQDCRANQTNHFRDHETLQMDDASRSQS